MAKTFLSNGAGSRELEFSRSLKALYSARVVLLASVGFACKRNALSRGFCGTGDTTARSETILRVSWVFEGRGVAP